MASNSDSLAGHVVGAFTDLLAQGAFSAASRAVAREANEFAPGVPPTPDQLLTLYQRGEITYAQLNQAWLDHGVPMPSNTRQGAPGRFATYWDSWAKTSFPIPTIPELRAAHKRGLLSDEVYEMCIDYHGYSIHSQSPDQTNNRARGQLRELIRKLTAPLSIGDVQRLRNWEVIGQRRAIEEFYAMGHVDERQQAELEMLRYEVPGPSDLVRFAIRHVFEPDLASHFGFNDEYRPVLDIFHHAHGMEYPIFTGPLRGAVSALESETGKTPEQWKAEYERFGLPEPTWAHSYWWSHWILPSPTQGYEMYQRLRPNRMHLYQADSPDVRPFTLQDLSLLLRGNDYPPYFRPELIAINYRPMTRVDIRRAFSIGSIDRAEVFERYRDLGYDQITSRVLTQIAEDSKARDVTQPAKNRLAKCVEQSFAIGAADRESTIRRLENLLPNPGSASIITQAVQCEEGLRRVKNLVAAIKARYLRAETNEDQARIELQRASIIPERITQYLADWLVIRQYRGNSLTLAQIQRAYKRGLITDRDFVVRVNNLGYEDRDAKILLQMAGEDRELARAASRRMSARTQRERERSAEQELRLLERRKREIGRELAGYGTPSKWASYAIKAVITWPEYYRRTRLIGLDDAAAYELAKDRAIKLGRQGGSQPTPPPSKPTPQASGS